MSHQISFIRRTASWPAWALAACLGGLGATGCSKSAASGDRSRSGENRPVPVTVAVAEVRPVPEELSAIGTAMASASVSVRSEVSGALTEVHFCQGQDANRGDVLFTIDPRPFQASLKQAEAALARDQYQADNARIDLEREKELLEKKISSQSDYDKKKADAEGLAAVVRSAQAAVDNARLQLEHCTISSPIAGRTGDLLVDRGNLVKANEQVLVTINQVRPIRVSFAIPQQYLRTVKQRMSQGRLEVRAWPPNEETDPEAGELSFVDNAVDKTTGMIALQGTFANDRERLWPGLFVHVNLVLSIDPNAIVVPARAVQVGRDGKYVFVVKADRSVEFRPVTIRLSNTEIAVVEKGLAVGETVATDGHLKLVHGSKVEIKPDARGAGTQGSPASAPGGRGPATRKAPQGGRP